ncbi:hypothetical protein [Burkholderia sp. JKS000303]|uniref:hypothetical protein n=1 Tax=Burkholderia sp. JKS000303 TaxID=1938747 RepID=UPI000BF349E9|nr:hypothetical protein [Burkholderia sp. JKS000303]PFH19548.1 hypothetical protein BX604_6153 [Burkholderia sp. JKS000303]
MTVKRCRITGFRIARTAAKRDRSTIGHRVETMQVIGTFIANALHDSLARVMRGFAAEHGLRPASQPVSRPPRKVFDTGRIDHSKSQLPIISEAEARAVGRRKTLLHFGQDPDQ